MSTEKEEAFINWYRATINDEISDHELSVIWHHFKRYHIDPLQSELSQVKEERDKLLQIRDNLVDRAIKNTREDGEEITGLKHTISELQTERDHLKTSFEVMVKKLQEENDVLAAFKTYVHDRLDKMGIPADPEPENNASHGCRIEGRINFVQVEVDQLKEELQKPCDHCAC